MRYRERGTGPWTEFNNLVTTVPRTTTSPAFSGKAWEFQVAAVNSEGTGAYSDTAILPGPPGAPGNFRVTDISNQNQDVLAWDVPSDNGGGQITGYKLERRQIGQTAWETAVDKGATQRTHNYGKASWGVGYDYRVRAVNSAGEGANSNVIKVGGRPTLKSGAAGTPTATPATDRVAVTLDWSGTLDQNGGKAISEWRYRYKPSSSSAWSQVNNIAPGTTSVTVEGPPLLPGIAYDFDVIACNEDRCSFTSPDATGAMTLDQATASIANAAADEGDAITFTVTLSSARTSNVTLNWATSNGSATAPADYTATASGSVTIPAGQTSRTFMVQTAPDALDEDDETFTVTLSAPSDGLPASVLLAQDPTATGTITDDDAPPVLSITSPSVNEGDSGTTAMTFELTLDAPSGREVAVGVDFAREDSTATEVVDYLWFVGHSVTFMPGETAKTYNVTVNGDTTVEEDETVVVQFSITKAVFDPSLNADTETVMGLAFADVTGTILNDDTAPTTIALSVSPTSINEGDTATGVTLTASFPPGSGTLATATDLVFTGAGTATPADDYALTVGGSGELTIRIPAGATSGTNANTVTLSPVNDDDPEGDETIVFSVATPPSGFTSVSPATFTIVDDDQSARVSTTHPSPLTEAGLDGARLTVDLVGTEYISSLAPGDFGLLPQGTAGLSVASVDRRSNTRAVVTLAFTGNFAADLDLQVAVGGSAHTAASTSLTTAAVTVTQAPKPGQVTNVAATGGPGSLAVTWRAASNADGYTVSWWPTASPGDVESRRVAGGSITRTDIGGLAGETGYSARVVANSNHAPDGPPSNTASAITEPSDAIVSGTDPAPLTEANLDGAKLVVEFLDQPYLAWWRTLQVGQFTASGVPGVRVSAVERLSDRQARLTLAYDDTDFDTDRRLRIAIDGLAFNSGNDISAATDVRAVVEAPPARVRNVRATAGTQRVRVQWDEVPTAIENLDLNVYKVQWKESAASGGWRERRVRGSQTALTIGAAPGTGYTVRVVATRHKAPDGPRSAEAQATTPAFGYRVKGTEPAQLTGVNLNGAAVIVELQGAEWNLGLPRRLFRLSGLDTGVRVERVEPVSRSEARIVLGHRGPSITEDGALTITIDEDTYSWNGDLTVTVPVKAPGHASGVRVRETTDTTVTVEWDRFEGVNVYYQVRWKESEADGGWRGRWMRGWSNPKSMPSYRIRDLTPGTEYTVQVRYYDRGGVGFGRWTTATMTPGETETPGGDFEVAQNQTAGVTVAADDPVQVGEGGEAGYTVVLDGRPAGDVTIAVSSDNADVTAEPASLTFTPDNWQTAQTVTVSAAHDGDAADEAATLSHAVSGADGYAGIAVASVAVVVTDDDTAGVTVSESTLSLEEGGSSTYTLVLDTQPVSDVVIYPTAHGDGLTAAPSELTFTPQNWNQAQTVTVSAAHDGDKLDGQGIITHSILVPPESAYASVGVAGIAVSVDDDDLQALAAQEAPPPLWTLTLVREDRPFTTVAEADAEYPSTFLRLERGASTAPIPDWLPVTVGGTAASPADYEFNRGNQFRGITRKSDDLMRGARKITVRGDALDEGAETITFSVTVEGETLTATLDIVEEPLAAVADASVQEAAGAVLGFRVTLAPAPDGPVTVDWTTADGSAAAGADYTAASGTLTFAAGDTEKTISVAVLDDDIDEGAETMTLRLSNAAGAVLGDAEAVGTIANTDPMPQAWLARFGRTVADQVIDAVTARFEAAPQAGSAVSIAGQAMGAGGSPEARAACAARPPAHRDRHGIDAPADGNRAGFGAGAGGPGERCRSEMRALTGRDLLTGSSFSVTGGSAEAGFGTVWGSGAVTRFDGREGGLTLDGEVLSALLGADFRRDRAVLGLALAHSRGDGSYRGAGSGEVESTLTGLYPYGRYEAGERLSLWGIAGLGAGTLTLTPEGGGAVEADTDMAMAAAGARGVLAEAPDGGGPELAVKSDLLLLRISSDAARDGAGGRLAAADADVTRLRLGLEGSWGGVGTEGGVTLTPTLEVGLRHDGGDAETGFGVEAGAGLAWTDPASGIAAELRARGLLAHEAGGFRERGVSGSFAWDPASGSGRGPSLTLTQTLGGPASGGVDALFRDGALTGLDANGDGFGARRFETKLGYGFGAFGDRFTVTPEAGFGLSNAGRDYRLGWRLNPSGGGSSLELRLEATRREAANDNGAEPEHTVGVRLNARW